MTLKTIDLTPRIGAEIVADIDTLVSGAHAAQILDLLEQRGVLVGREIHMDEAQQNAFSETLGGVQGQFGSTIQRISIGKDMTFTADYPFEGGRMLHRTTIEAKEELVGG